MNLLSDLDQAINILNRCEGTPEIQKAQMNFVVNLVTILELFSKAVLRDSTGDRSLDCDSLPLSIILPVVGTKEEKYLISKMVQLRNEIVHEGKSTSLTDEEVDSLCAIVEKIITKRHVHL